MDLHRTFVRLVFFLSFFHFILLAMRFLSIILDRLRFSYCSFAAILVGTLCAPAWALSANNGSTLHSTSASVSYKTVSPKVARALLDTACHTIIIDVRSEKEFMSATGHLDDARRIGYDSLAVHSAELEEFKDRPMLVYCRSGGRGAKAAESLIKLGFTQVYNLEGGITAWNKAGMIVTHEKQSSSIGSKKR